MFLPRNNDPSPFSRHGINHLSASSLGLWRAQPALWAVQYLHGFRDQVNPAMQRGKAVEAGLEWWLRRKEPEKALEHAMSVFEHEMQGMADDETQAERELVPDMLARAIDAFDGFDGTLLGTQFKVECWFDGVTIPVIGYLDFLFEDGAVLDLKTSKACPSSPKPDHARQVALYCHARGVDSGSLLYVTAKKWARLPVEEIEPALAELRRDALSLQRFLSRCDDAVDAVSRLPADTDHFRWSENSITELNRLLEGDSHVYASSQ